MSRDLGGPGRRSDSDPAEQMSPDQLDPWMQQKPKPELANPDTGAAGGAGKVDPIDSQQPPMNFESSGQRGEEGSTGPVQVEQEWQPPELSNKKIDKTKDLPHAREFDH